jgi:hypothetical protein
MHIEYDQFSERVLAHNILFPDTKLDFEGFVEHDDFLWPVVSQSHVSSERGATVQEIKQHMAGLGFRPKNDTDFINDSGNSPSFG